MRHTICLIFALAFTLALPAVTHAKKKWNDNKPVILPDLGDYLPSPSPTAAKHYKTLQPTLAIPPDPFDQPFSSSTESDKAENRAIEKHANRTDDDSEPEIDSALVSLVDKEQQDYDALIGNKTNNSSTVQVDRVEHDEIAAIVAKDDVNITAESSFTDDDESGGQEEDQEQEEDIEEAEESEDVDKIDDAAAKKLAATVNSTSSFSTEDTEADDTVLATEPVNSTLHTTLDSDSINAPPDVDDKLEEEVEEEDEIEDESDDDKPEPDVESSSEIKAAETSEKGVDADADADAKSDAESEEARLEAAGDEEEAEEVEDAIEIKEAASIQTAEEAEDESEEAADGLEDEDNEIDDNAIAKDDVSIQEEKREQNAIDGGEFPTVAYPTDTTLGPTDGNTEYDMRDAAIVLSIVSSALLSIGACMQKAAGYDSPQGTTFFDLFGIVGSTMVLLGVVLGALICGYLPMASIAVLNAFVMVFTQLLELFFFGAEFDMLTGTSLTLTIPGVIISLMGANIIDDNFTPLQIEAHLGSPISVAVTVFAIIVVILGMYACETGRKKDPSNDIALLGRVCAGAMVAGWYTLLLKTFLELILFGGKHGFSSLNPYIPFLISIVVLILCVAILKVAVVSAALKSYHILLYTPLYQSIALLVTAFFGVLYYDEFNDERLHEVKASLYTYCFGLLLVVIGVGLPAAKYDPYIHGGGEDDDAVEKQGLMEEGIFERTGRTSGVSNNRGYSDENTNIATV